MAVWLGEDTVNYFAGPANLTLTEQVNTDTGTFSYSAVNKRLTVSTAGTYCFVFDAWVKTNASSVEECKVDLRRNNESVTLATNYVQIDPADGTNGENIQIVWSHTVASSETFGVVGTNTSSVRHESCRLLVFGDPSDIAVPPTDAQYVTLATDSDLSNERVLTAGTGITLTDGGAGSTVTVATATNRSLALQTARGAMLACKCGPMMLVSFTNWAYGAYAETDLTGVVLDDAITLVQAFRTTTVQPGLSEPGSLNALLRAEYTLDSYRALTDSSGGVPPS